MYYLWISLIIIFFQFHEIIEYWIILKYLFWNYVKYIMQGIIWMKWFIKNDIKEYKYESYWRIQFQIILKDTIWYEIKTIDFGFH